MKKVRMALLLLLLLMSTINYYQVSNLFDLDNQELNEDEQLNNRKIPILASNSTVIAERIRNHNQATELHWLGEQNLENANNNKTMYSGIRLPSYKITTRGPIAIDNDTAFGPTGYNFTGSGTEGYPYIIEGYNITDPTTNLIDIRNTTSHFIIRNSWLDGVTGTVGNNGIYFENVTNGVIRNNTIHSCFFGMWIESSNDTIILENKIYNNSASGIILRMSTIDTTVSRNKIYNSSNNAIFVYYANFTILSNNDLFNNSGSGIEIQESFHNYVSGNNISYNNGNFLYSSDNNTIINNTIVGNSYTGILADSGADDNIVKNNNFFGNNDSGIQAWDDGSNNNFTYNYWDDHSGTDSNGDGIFDAVYSLVGSAGNTDPYPLVHPYYGYITRDTIYIDDNTDFATLGFPGAGTLNNPYLIEGYNITDPINYLIYVQNTDFYFVIRNNVLDGITASQEGIVLTNARNGIVERNIIHSTVRAILVQGSLCYNNTVFNNKIYNNSLYGIYVTSSSHDNVISGNVVYNCSDIGIFQDGSSRNTTIANNIVFNSTFSGIKIATAYNNTLANNTVFNIAGFSPNAGIWLEWADNNTVFNNTIYYNSDSGLVVLNSNDNNVTSNNLFNNTQYGIHIWFSSNNYISRNVLTDNIQYGIFVDSLSAGNTLEWNHFFGNNLGGTQANDAGSVNIFTYNYWDDHSGQDSEPDGIFDTPYNIIGGNFDPYPLAYPFQPHAPIYIDDNADFAALGFPGTGTVDDPYVIEQYFIINSTTNLIDIQDTTAHFIIRNNQLNGLDRSFDAIRLWNVMNGTIDNNIICYSRIGIVVSLTNDSVIYGNTIHSNGYEGIWVVNWATKNTLFGNTIYNNTENGIRLSNFAANNTVSGNTIYDNADNQYRAGIQVINSQYNNITSNIIFNNSNSGIRLSTSQFNRFFNNTVYNNAPSTDSAGIYLYTGANNNTFSKNNVSRNLKWGILVYSHNNTFYDNFVHNNAFDGVLINIGMENTFYDNNIYNNSWRGFSIQNGGNWIYFNNIQNNILAPVLDSNGTNHFHRYGLGNYWGSAFTGSDVNGDRVGDTPYTFNGNQDPCPLMYPIEWYLSLNASVIVGDWSVIGTEYHENEFITLSGNLNISSSGNLTLHNVILRFSCSFDGQYHIEVNGGNLTIEANSTVTTLNVTNAWYLKAYSGSNILLKNSTFSYAGYEYQDLSGLWISTNSAQVLNCSIHNNFIGIYLNKTNDVLIKDNTINNIYAFGIHISESNNNIILSNLIANNNQGIAMGPYCNNNNITGNIIYNSSDIGISIAELSNNNNISSNIIYDIKNAGLWVVNSNNNILFNNTLFNNNPGIELNIGAGSNHIYLNNIINNTQSALDQNGTNFFYHIGLGNYWGSEYTGSDANNDGIGDTSYTVPGTPGNIDPYPLIYPAEWYSVIKGDWSVTGTEYHENEFITLSGNLTISSTGSLTLNNVTLWMNCSFDGQYHIEVNSGGNLTIIDSVVTSTNTSNAWYLKSNSGSFILLDKSTFSFAGWDYGINGDKTGIRINSDNAQIINCTFHHNYYGIYLYQTDFSLIANNTFTNNLWHGMFISSSTNNLISDNVIAHNLQHGISMGSSSNYNNITNNQIYNNSLDGIAIDGAHNNTLLNNVIQNHFHGISLTYSLNTTCSYNSIYKSSSDSIYLYYANYTTIIGNNVSNNAVDGMMLGFSYHNIIINNTFSNNNLVGMYFGYSSFNLVMTNLISNHLNDTYGIGILVSYCTNNTISNNTISDNVNFAMFLSPLSANNTIKWNDFLNNNPNNTMGLGSSQAYDNGTANLFTYNFWSDWTDPDSEPNGIVDVPYIINGSAGNSDQYPLAFTAIHDLSIPTIRYPNDGGVFGLVIILQWDPANDSWNHPVTYTLFYSSDGGGTWTLIDSDWKNTNYTWDTTSPLVLNGTNYLIQVKATCSTGFWQVDTSDFVFTINNVLVDLTPPEITIFPSNYSYVELTVGHSLTWIATDQLPDTYTIWRNNTPISNYINVDWFNNAPITINIDNLSPGLYIYKIEFLDSSGKSSTHEVWVTVTENAPPIVTITQPEQDDILDGTIAIAWTAIDPEGEPMTYSVDYWNGNSWINLATSLSTTSTIWDTTNVIDRPDYKIRVNASDGYKIGVNESGLFTINNIESFAQIPAGFTKFEVTDTITVGLDVKNSVNVTINRLSDSDVPDPPSDLESLNIYLNITLSDPDALNDLWINISFDELNGRDPNNVKIYYFNEDDERWLEAKETGVDDDNRVVWAWTDHLTLFGVMDEQVQPAGEWLEVLLMAFFLITPVIVVTVFIYKRAKKGMRMKKAKAEIRQSQIDLGILTRDFDKD